MPTASGSVPNARLAPLPNKQSPQAKKASRCLHDRRPSRHPPSPMVLATPFFRHLARPREAEKTEREKVMMNSRRPSMKVPSPKTVSPRLTSPAPVRIFSNS